MATRVLILTEGELAVLQDAMNLWRFDHRSKKDTDTKRERMYLDEVESQIGGRYDDDRIDDLIDIAARMAFDAMD
jgi:hypothetical protein